jgi:hypothetical protein
MVVITSLWFPSPFQQVCRERMAEDVAAGRLRHTAGGSAFDDDDKIDFE